MYRVIGSPRTRAFRVLWMLEELDQPYEIIAKPPHSAEIREHNPSGKVPVLLDGEQPVIDSAAIIQYLADKHGTCTHKAGSIDRGRQDSFTQTVLDDFDAVLWTAARNTFILPEEKRVPAIIDTLKWEFTRNVAALEARLADREFLMGDVFTVPDILLTHCCGWARNTGFDLGDGPLLAYSKRNVGRAAYQRAHQHRLG